MIWVLYGDTVQYWTVLHVASYLLRTLYMILGAVIARRRSGNTAQCAPGKVQR
jgi:hypothetical protein